MTVYIECPSCRETPTDINWREYNIGVENLGADNIPKEGFEDIDDFYEFAENTGTRLDCPECGEVCYLSDCEGF